jgi:putative ABC transport system substrate-binding protein
MIEPLSQKKHIVLVAIVVFLSLLSHTSFVSAGEIVALKSSSMNPYDEALAGFRSTCKCTVRELNLAEMDKRDVKEMILRSKPAAVLAIGTDALNSVLNISGLPVFYTLALPPGPEITDTRKNLSGVGMDIPPETFLSTMARLFPRAKRIGLVYSKRNTGNFVKAAKAISRSMLLEIIALENSDPGQTPALLQTLRGKIDVFWILPDPTVTTPGTIDSILLFSFQNNVPVVSFTKKHVKMGALASLSVNPFDLGAQTGEIALKKLNNSRSGIPAFSNPQKINLSVNNTVAEKLGIPLTDAVLREAGEVY